MTTPPLFDSTDLNSPLTARHLGSPVLELALTVANGKEVVLEAYLLLDTSTVVYALSTTPHGERPQFFSALGAALEAYNSARQTILTRRGNPHA